jgi:flavodoxin I
MKSLVVYFSRGGNTRKVAEAISQELGCRASNVMKGTPDVSGLDLLMVGSGNYGNNVGNGLQGFLNSLPQSNTGKAAVFATAGGPEPKCISVMQVALEEKGYKVISNFKCRGQTFFFLNRGHPNEDDLQNAKLFAGDLKKRAF